jgi:K+-sensing histidine kinase KdpD
MRIKNSKSWAPYPLSQSVIGASFILLVSFLIRLGLHETIEPYAPFHFFIVACIAIAYLYGYKLALAGVVVSTVLGGYYFIPPYNSFGTPASSDWLQFANFAAVTMVAIIVIENLQRSIYSRNLMLKVMQSRYRLALLNENDQLVTAQKNNANWALLQKLLTRFDDILLLQFADASIKLQPLFFEISHFSGKALNSNDWQHYIHSDDLPYLMQLLALEPSEAKPESHLTLRLNEITGPKMRECKLENYTFLDQPLKVLRVVS